MTINKQFLPLLCWASLLLLFLTILAGCSSSLPEQSQTAAPAQNTPQEVRTPMPGEASPTSPAAQESYENIDAENGVEEIEWGQEIDKDKMLELARSGNVFEIQWHMMPNVIRFLMNDGQIYHFNNEKVSIDILTYLEKAGIKVGKGGITFRYSFCN